MPHFFLVYNIKPYFKNHSAINSVIWLWQRLSWITFLLCVCVSVQSLLMLSASCWHASFLRGGHCLRSPLGLPVTDCGSGVLAWPRDDWSSTCEELTSEGDAQAAESVRAELVTVSRTAFINRPVKVFCGSFQVRRKSFICQICFFQGSVLRIQRRQGQQVKTSFNLHN